MADPVLEACVERVRTAEKPLSVRQIRAGLEKALRFPPRRTAEFEGLLLDRARSGGIHRWPGAGAAGVRFWHRSLSECLREAILASLAARPLTANPLFGAVQRSLDRVSRAAVKAEAGALLPALEDEGLVRKEAVGRQPLYISREWAAGFAGAQPAGEALSKSILEAVAAMESGYGNYVPVYRLRNADAVRREFDRAVIALADAGRLVLSSYNGPRPVPPERALDYAEDEQRRLYVAVARPLPPGVS